MRAPASRRRSVALCSGISWDVFKQTLEELCLRVQRSNQAIDFLMIPVTRFTIRRLPPPARLRPIPSCCSSSARTCSTSARAGSSPAIRRTARRPRAVDRRRSSARRTSRSRPRSSRRSTAPTISWLLSNVYLAAQLVVLPGALFALYRRARPIYRRLRATVLATWMIAVPIHGLWPVAPPRLAGLGIARHRQRPDRPALRPLDDLLQRVRRSTEPARRIRLRDQHRVGGGVAGCGGRRRSCCSGARSSRSRSIATGNHFVFDAVAGLRRHRAPASRSASLLPRIAHHWAMPQRHVLVAI